MEFSLDPAVLQRAQSLVARVADDLVRDITFGANGCVVGANLR